MEIDLAPADRMQVFHDEHGNGGPVARILTPLNVGPNATSAWKERDLVIRTGAFVCVGTPFAIPVTQQFKMSVLLTIANADSGCNKYR